MHHGPSFGANPGDANVRILIAEQRLAGEAALILAKHECLRRAVGDVLKGMDLAVDEDADPIALRGNLPISTGYTHVIGLAVPFFVHEDTAGPTDERFVAAFQRDRRVDAPAFRLLRRRGRTDETRYL